jgi:hypothetical protein
LKPTCYSSILLNVMAITKINEITVCAQGISEVVLDQEAMDLAYGLSKEIAAAIRVRQVIKFS